MDQAKPQRVVVMTGATPGLGAHALQHIAAQPDTRVIIGARGSGRTVPRGVEVMPLDLASLASVREFADAVTRRLGDARIDILVPPPGRIYVSLVKGKPTFPNPSELARNRDAQDRLQRESAAMVGIE